MIVAATALVLAYLTVAVGFALSDARRSLVPIGWAVAFAVFCWPVWVLLAMGNALARWTVAQGRA